MGFSFCPKRAKCGKERGQSQPPNTYSWFTCHATRRSLFGHEEKRREKLDKPTTQGCGASCWRSVFRVYSHFYAKLTAAMGVLMR